MTEAPDRPVIRPGDFFACAISHKKISPGVRPGEIFDKTLSC
jgi:hypothetical protein